MEITEFRTDLLGDCSMLRLKAISGDSCIAIGLGAMLAVQKPDIAENYRHGYHS